MKMRVPIIIFLCFLLVIVCQGRVITVDDDGPADFNNIQAAIDDANDFDTVEVQPGTYTGNGNRDIDFDGKAITVRSIDPNDPCIVEATMIDCGGSSSNRYRGFYFNSGEDVNSVIDGLTIRNGWAPIEPIGPLGWEASAGGGICCNQSSPLISNCIIIDNIASRREGYDTTISFGGGIYCIDSNIVVRNCLIQNNGELPGISEPQFPETIDGGGIFANLSNIKLLNSRIIGNAAGCGGGVYLSGCGVTVFNCEITGNKALHGGGVHTAGIMIWPGGIFKGNYLLRNCVINNNEAFIRGGGMLCGDSNSTLIQNCTIYGNDIGGTAETGGIYCFQSSPVISSCIIWANEDTQIAQGNPVVSYCDVEGGFPGVGNIDIDPCFVDSANGDYHLRSEGWRWDADANEWTWDEVTSRCIDAGNPGCPTGSEPLPHSGNRINMGAYGGTAEASIPLHNWAILGDLNNDGTVNFEDYAFQAVDWEKTEDCQPGDLNRNGSIDMNDIALLSEDWLKQTTWY